MWRAFLLQIADLVGYDAFISYRRTDAAKYASALASKLERRDGRVTYAVFVDRRGISPGDHFSNLLQWRIRRCRTFVLIETPDAKLDSRWVPREIVAAFEASRPIVRVVHPAAPWWNWHTRYVPGDVRHLFDKLEDQNRDYCIEFDPVKFGRGEPAPTIVKRIQDRLGRSRARIVAALMALALAVSMLGGIVFGPVAAWVRHRADDARNDPSHSLASAELLARIAALLQQRDPARRISEVVLKSRQTYRTTPEKSVQLAVFGEGEREAVVIEENNRGVMEIAHFRDLLTLTPKRRAVEAVRLLATGVLPVPLLLVSRDRVAVWTKGNLRTCAYGPNPRDVRALAISGNARILAVSTGDDVYLWNLPECTSAVSLRRATQFAASMDLSGIRALALSPHGEWMITAASTQVTVWRLTTSGKARTVKTEFVSSLSPESQEGPVDPTVSFLDNHTFLLARLGGVRKFIRANGHWEPAGGEVQRAVRNILVGRCGEPFAATLGAVDGQYARVWERSAAAVASSEFRNWESLPVPDVARHPTSAAVLPSTRTFVAASEDDRQSLATFALPVTLSAKDAVVKRNETGAISDVDLLQRVKRVQVSGRWLLAQSDTAVRLYETR